MAAQRSNPFTSSAADWGAKDAAANIDKAVPLLASGMTSDEVAARLKLSNGSTVRGWLFAYPQMREAVANLQRGMAEAVARRAMSRLPALIDMAADMAEDPRIEPQHRLRAFRHVADIAFKAREHFELEATVEELRAAVADLPQNKVM